MANIPDVNVNLALFQGHKNYILLMDVFQVQMLINNVDLVDIFVLYHHFHSHIIQYLFLLFVSLFSFFFVLFFPMHKILNTQLIYQGHFA